MDYSSNLTIYLVGGIIGIVFIYLIYLGMKKNIKSEQKSFLRFWSPLLFIREWWDWNAFKPNKKNVLISLLFGFVVLSFGYLDYLSRGKTDIIMILFYAIGTFLFWYIVISVFAGPAAKYRWKSVGVDIDLIRSGSKEERLKKQRMFTGFAIKNLVIPFFMAIIGLTALIILLLSLTGRIEYSLIGFVFIIVLLIVEAIYWYSHLSKMNDQQKKQIQK